MTCRSPEAIARRALRERERKRSPEYRARKDAARRKPCARCGGTKDAGNARRLCDACTLADQVWCPACETHKPRDAFHAAPSRRTGMASYCRGCAVTRNREGRYGLERGELTRRVAAQDGRCAACRLPVADWHIDHDHSCCAYGTKGCGQCTRDLLCRPCNLAIGLIKDDPQRALALAAYLTRWKG